MKRSTPVNLIKLKRSERKRSGSESFFKTAENQAANSQRVGNHRDTTRGILTRQNQYGSTTRLKLDNYRACSKPTEISTVFEIT